MDIVAVGMASPLGWRSRPMLAAARAGLVAIDEIEVPGFGDRLVSRLESEDEEDSLELGESRYERATNLAAAALAELVEAGPWPSPPAVLLAAPESGPGEGLDVASIWRSLVSDCSLTAKEPRLFTSGPAGAFEALVAANEMIEAGEVEAALIGGFDSLVDAGTLERLAATEGPRRWRPHDDRVPGEGAAFLLLARPDQPSFAGRALARIADFALTRDPEPFASGAPSRGTGLTAAFAELRGRATGAVEVVRAATPARGWWGQEISYAYLRNAALMPEPFVLESLHEHIGDPGAAAGVAAMVSSVRGASPLVDRAGAPVHRSALVYASSETGIVGACRIEAI